MMKIEHSIEDNFTNHNYEEVIYLIKKYKNKIKNIPEHKIILFLAISYEKINQLHKGITVLEKFLSQYTNLEIKIKLAEYYALSNNSKRAVALVEEVYNDIDKNDDIYIHFLITAAVIYTESSLQDKAEKYLKKAMKFVSGVENNYKLKLKIFLVYSVIEFRKGFIKKAINYANKVIANKEKAELEDLANIYHYYAIFQSILYNQVEALHYNTLSLKLNLKLNNKRDIIKVYISLGITYLNIGEIILGENLLNKALDLLAETNEYKQKGRIYAGLGHISIIKGDYTAALKFFQKDYQYAKNFENRHIMAFPIRNIGRVNLLLNNKEEALKNFEESKELFKEAGDEINYAISLTEIAECIADDKSIEYIKRLIEEAKKIFKNKDREVQFAFAEYRLGKIYMKKGLNLKAEKSFMIAKKILEKYDCYSRLNEVIFNLGKLYFFRKKYDIALQYFSQSYKYSKEYNFLYMIPKIIDFLDKLDKTSIIDIGTKYILRKEKDKTEREVLKETIKKYSNITTLIVKDNKMKNILKSINDIAPTDVSVLITGETGTGKELIARYIHSKSLRKEYQMIVVNCAAIPENLIESELFGHKKGSFTGATSDYKGKFKIANNGTIFLDEIGELSMNAQKALLRFLQEGEIQPIGSIATEIVNVRVIAATNKNILQEIEEKKFREDLYYRLNTFHIEIPPLRTRKDDIEELIKYFIKYFSKVHSKDIKNISNNALNILLKYDWPGNVRELRNIIEIAVIRSKNKVLHSIYFQDLIKQKKENKFITLKEKEKQYILEVLKSTNYNYSETAKILGIHRNTLHNKILQFKM